MAVQKGKIKSLNSPLPDFGRVPPQAIDMEEAVLGAIMLEKEAVISVLDILKPESFYKGLGTNLILHLRLFLKEYLSLPSSELTMKLTELYYTFPSDTSIVIFLSCFDSIFIIFI